MGSTTASLVIKVVDQATQPASKVAKALKSAEAQAKAIARATEHGLSNKLGDGLLRVGASAKEIDKVSAAFQHYARAAGIAGRATDWTKTQAAQVRAWESATVAAIRKVKRGRRPAVE